MRRRRVRPPLLIGAAIAGIVVVAALVSLAFDPYEVTRPVIVDRFLRPSLAHPLGTDHNGRDVFLMTLLGARSALYVALVSVLVGAAVGVPAGLFAAARGGVPGEAAMRAGDILFAFPALVTAAMIAAVFGPSATGAALAIGVFNVPVFARLARAGGLALMGRDFILAARLAGKRMPRVVAEHVLPNVAGVLVVEGATLTGFGILAEAGLSFVGLGTQSPMPSWGRMLYETQTMIPLAPHLVLPGVVVIVAVIGFNMLGDGINDALDPRLGPA